MCASTVPGLLLAGGRSRRMGLAEGQDKCLMALGGMTLLERVIERAAPQVGPLVLNANGDPTRFSTFGLPVIADAVGAVSGEDSCGPLAGVLAGLDWTAEQMPEAEHMASFTTDTPFFPDNLVARLLLRVERGTRLVCAREIGASGADPFGGYRELTTSPKTQKVLSPVKASASSSLGVRDVGHLQPLFALWPVALRHELRRALLKEGVRKVDRWMTRYGLAVVDFAVDAANCFFNINRPSDIKSAERLLSAAHDSKRTRPSGLVLRDQSMLWVQGHD